MSIALALSVSSQGMSDAPDAPDQPNVPGPTVALTHHDTGFTVQDTSAHGLYADGSPWVQATGQTSLIAATPASVTATGVMDTTPYTDETLHGMMRDPGQAEVPGAALAVLQDNNMRKWRGQGWDGRRVNTFEALAYDATHNVDPGATGQAILLNTPASYVKAVSDPATQDQKEIINSYGVLTVVSSAPVHGDACRPAMALPDKTSRWRTSDIVLPAADPKSYIGLPSYAYFDAQLVILHHMHDTNASACRATTTGPDGGYGGSIAEVYAQALLWIKYGDGTAPERLDIARRICQAAEDVRGRILQGGIVTANGGWCQWADVILVGAEELLTGHFADARDTLIVTTGDRGDVTWAPVGAPALAEMRRVEPVVQAWLDIDPQYVSAPYTAKQLGWPEWSAGLGTNKGLPDGQNNRLEELENLLPKASSITLDPDDKPGYRHITMKAMVPLTLFLRAVGSSFITTNQFYFDYVDRHMGEIISSGGDYTDLPGATDNPLADWVIEAWKDVRGIEGVWSSTAVTIQLTQSEVKIGLMSTVSTDARAAQMPTLLSGVDARIAVKARHDIDASGGGMGDQIIILTQAAIDTQKVNPGFVAAANLMHLGSGGKPFRLVDGTRSGTSMTDMMDDDETSRHFSEDASVVKLASVAFGSISRATYNWWNAEASAAKSLRTSRWPHFFGINHDQTPHAYTALEHCLIDTQNTGRGLLPSDTVVDMMMPGIEVRNPTGTYSPAQINYTTDTSGDKITGRVDQNGTPAYQERIDFLTDAPAANTGRALVSPALVRFGDYVGGAQMSQPAQSDIHPSITERDGQVLFAQDTAAGMLIAQGYYDAPVLDRVDWAADGTYADFIYAIPDDATLTTQRIRDGETVASPRPHQQEVMGFVVYRAGDSDRTARPLLRTDNTDDTAYPPAYRGTAVIHDTGTGSGGTREAVVRITPSTAFANGDVIHFGTDGNYGDFCIHGAPDYDARLYRDGLRAHISALESGIETYPGIPVRAQQIATAAGITAGPVGDPFATKLEGASSAFTGPNLASGTQAMTVLLDVDIADGSNLCRLLRYSAQTLDVILDARSGKRGFDILVEAADGTKIAAMDYVDGEFPAGRRTFLLTMTQDRGDGNAETRLYVDGVFLRNEVRTSKANPVFASNRSLDLFNGGNADQTLYGGTIWTSTDNAAWSATGDTSGFGAPLHQISGDTATFNAGGNGLTKVGDPFT